MFKIAARFALLAVALALTACNPVTIGNPFGGPPLVLTGNYNADLPSITAFNASIKAGIKADVALVRQFFVNACPYVADASSKVPVAQAAAQQLGMSASAAEKQAANVHQTLIAAGKLCAAGTATDSQSFFSAVVDAFEWVYGMIKHAQG
jgi:hypothetical protein